MTERAPRILIVEDDRILRRAAETTLKREGYRVVTAADGEEALTAARAEPPDLILLDLIMPRMQGFDVLRALKQDERTALIPVIVLSNLGQERDVRQAIETGAVAYFVKADVSLKGLVRRVQEPLHAAGA
jgi:CheY-like chemotaxis protein